MSWLSAQLFVLLFLGILIAGCAGGGENGVGSTDFSAPFRFFYVYTANAGSNSISEFQGSQDGSLTFMGTVSCPASPIKLTTLGPNLYAVSNDRIMAFSGADKGQLTLKQTVTMTDAGKTYHPVSCIARTQVATDMLYVVGKADGTSSGLLQKYAIQIDGTLLFRGSVRGFNGPAAIGASLSVSRSSEDILVANKNDNTATLVYDPYNGPMAIAQTVKLSSASSANPVGIQYEPWDEGFYVADSLSGTLTYLRVSSATKDHPIDGIKVINSLNAGHLNCLGTTRKPGSLFTYLSIPSVLLTIDPTLNIIEGFTAANPSGSINTTFQKISGTIPPSGSDATAVDGIIILDNLKKGVGYGYCASAGSVRAYKAAPTGVGFVASYDSKGSGIVDLVVTNEVGAMPPLTLSPSSLAAGMVGTSYSQTLTVSGGDTSKDPSITLAKGALPPGLKLSSDKATLSGVPTKEGNYSFTLMVERGTATSSNEYTISVTSATTKGVFAELVNATTNSKDGQLSGVVSGTSLQAGQGAVSDNGVIGIGTDSLVVKRADGQQIASKSFRTTDTFRYVLVTVGNPSDGYDVIQDQFDLGAKPAAGASWFTFYPGVKGLTETVDFYLILPGDTIGTTPYKLTGVAPLTTTQTLKVANGGSATIVATEPGQPTSVIAQGTVQLSAGNSYLGVLVSPEGASAKFDVVTDHLK
ncbi:MAG TPA: Ig domain-containing protein [Fimbriimonas sp.]|nr:Ig domain-containing protein [Fimbriimonas sp.]